MGRNAFRLDFSTHMKIYLVIIMGKLQMFEHSILNEEEDVELALLDDFSLEEHGVGRWHHFEQEGEKNKVC